MRRSALVTALVLTGSGLAACSSGGGPPASTSVATAAPTAPGTGGPNGAGGQRQPVVSGLVAAVSGTTMQLQSATKQTAVSWIPKTAFSKQAAGIPADVTVGACVVARSASGATAAADGSISAATVQVTPGGTDSTCEGRIGGFGGGPTGAPSGMPSGAPSNGRDGQGGFRGLGAFGKVTAVDAAGFSVEQTLRTTPSASPTTTTARVQTSANTTYTKVVSAAASDVKVGICASANGQTSETGALTASAVLLRDAVNGSCPTGAPAGGPVGG